MDPRKEQRERERRWRLMQFIGLALLIHLAAAPMFEGLVPPADPQGPKRRVRLVALNQPTKLPARERINLPKPQEAKPVDLADARGQVVDIPPSADTRPPDDARFLSEHNTRVERETRSRHQRADYQNAMNEPTVAKVNEPGTPERAHDSRTLDVATAGSDAAKRKEQPRRDTVTLAMPAVRQRDQLALTIDNTLGTLKNQRQSEKVSGEGDRLRLSPDADAKKQVPGTDSAPQQTAKSIELVPQVGVLARLTGGPANDHLDNVEEGEGTFLNSREFKFASFFNRIKRDVSQHWNPIGEYQRRDPTGNIYGHRARLTVVNVTLRPDGTLASVEVAAGSGIDFLDREAALAFSRAQPFPNPPRGLVDASTGLITFPFGFHVDFSAGGGLQLPF